MADFKICQVQGVEEALEILGDHQTDAVVLAGGTDLVPMLKNQLIRPKYVLPMGQIKGMADTSSHGDLVCLGPMATHQQVKRSPLMGRYAPVLAEASGTVGSLQTRNLGTVAGNLGNASPSADSAPALLVLDAALRVRRRGGERMVPLSSFFVGPKTNCLRPDELITEIRFKKLDRGEGSAYCKLGRRSAVTMAVASAAAYVKMSEQGSILKEVRIALGSVAPTPIRASVTESKAAGLSIDEVCEVIEKEMGQDISPISDVRATAEYRQRIAFVLARRAVEKAFVRAKNSLEARA